MAKLYHAITFFTLLRLLTGDQMMFLTIMAAPLLMQTSIASKVSPNKGRSQQPHNICFFLLSSFWVVLFCLGFGLFSVCIFCLFGWRVLFGGFFVVLGFFPPIDLHYGQILKVKIWRQQKQNIIFLPHQPFFPSDLIPFSFTLQSLLLLLLVTMFFSHMTLSSRKGGQKYFSPQDLSVIDPCSATSVSNAFALSMFPFPTKFFRTVISHGDILLNALGSWLDKKQSVGT